MTNKQTNKHRRQFICHYKSNTNATILGSTYLKIADPLYIVITPRFILGIRI